MKLKGILRLILFVTVAGVFASCADYVNIKPKSVVPDSVKFSVNIIPIFNAKCNTPGCHATGSQSPDLSPQKAYNSLIFYGFVDTDTPASSIIYQKISTGSMQGNASQNDRDLILKWIQQGALDN